jgi:hypothetical protein
MADISDVRINEIKDISDSLEALSCTCPLFLKRQHQTNILSAHYDPRFVLEHGPVTYRGV